MQVGPHDSAVADAPPAVVGGRYALGPVIGAGSSAVVHRARDQRTDESVALKLFHPGSSADDLRQQRQEIKALSRLVHPGLVRLRDGGVQDGRQYVVTDLVDGTTLAQRLRSGPALSPLEVAGLGADLADALAHVHAGGFVHRDVKPANVLLDGTGRPRLADFGIARALDGTSVTATGYVVGTAAYLSPEQVRGERVGPPADVYALGLVLLEALTGKREYPGLAVESAMARLSRPPVIPEGLPGGLADLLRAMTAEDPERRPSAAAVVGAVRGDAALRPAAGATASRSSRMGALSRRMVTSLAASAAAAALIGGAIVAFSSAPSVPAGPGAGGGTVPLPSYDDAPRRTDVDAASPLGPALLGATRLDDGTYVDPVTGAPVPAPAGAPADPTASGPVAGLVQGGAPGPTPAAGAPTTAAPAGGGTATPGGGVGATVSVAPLPPVQVGVGNGNGNGNAYGHLSKEEKERQKAADKAAKQGSGT